MFDVLFQLIYYCFLQGGSFAPKNNTRSKQLLWLSINDAIQASELSESDISDLQYDILEGTCLFIYLFIYLLFKITEIILFMF